MLSTVVFSLLAAGAVTHALPQPLLRRDSCGYSPNETNARGATVASPAFLVRVEEHSTNATLGYIDAFSSNYALLGDRGSAAEGIYAPDYEAYGSLIFYAGVDATDRGFTAATQSLANTSSVAPVTTEGCGTAPIEITTKYDDRGSCDWAGYELNVHYECPFPGTTNDTPDPCWAQVYYICMETQLDGISDDTGVLYYGNATTAVIPSDCCVVDLVSECP